MKRKKTVIMIIVLIIIVVLATVALQFGKERKSEPLPEPQAGKAQIVVAIAIRGQTLILRNDDHFDWTDTEVALSHAGKSYTMKVGTIKKGETKGFYMDNFLSAEGDEFNAQRYKPDSITISANEAGGTFPITH